MGMAGWRCVGVVDRRIFLYCVCVFWCVDARAHIGMENECVLW